MKSEVNGKSHAIGMDAQYIALQEELVQCRRMADQHQLLLKLMRGIATANSLEEAFLFSLKNICEYTSWSCGEVWAIDPKVEKMRFRVSFTDPMKPELLPFRDSAQSVILDKGEGIAGKVWAAKNSIYLEDLSAGGIFTRQEMASQLQLHSGLGIPVMLDDEVIAVLAFYQAQGEKAIPEYIEMLSAVAGQLGMAIKQREAQDYLKISEARFRTLVASSPEGIVLINNKHEILHWNEKAVELFGYSPDETENQLVDMLLHERSRPTLDHELRHVLNICPKKRSIRPMETVGLRKDGSEFPADILISCWEEDHSIMYSLTIRDVTNRLRKENEIMRKSVALAKEVQVRKATEQHLLETAETLKTKNEELEQFAYIASHDLQEPLRMVASYTQLLKNRYEDKLDDEAREFISYAVDGAGRMQVLISDLLTLSRVGTRGQEFEETNMAEVVELAKSNLALQIEETDTVIKYGALPVVFADKSQLVQLMQNLISNGIKFAKKGVSPEITITANTLPEFWQISVTDNGIGIDQAFHDKVFQIFQRLHTREAYPGTGIGLALSKKIVERHAGKIWFESVPGQGTSFHYTLKRPTATVAQFPTPPLSPSVTP